MFLFASASVSTFPWALDQPLLMQIVRRSEQMNPRFNLSNASMISTTRLGSEELHCHRVRE